MESNSDLKLKVERMQLAAIRGVEFAHLSGSHSILFTTASIAISIPHSSIGPFPVYSKTSFFLPSRVAPTLTSACRRALLGESVSNTDSWLTVVILSACAPQATYQSRNWRKGWQSRSIGCI